MIECSPSPRAISTGKWTGEPKKRECRASESTIFVTARFHLSYMGMNILEYIDWLMDQGMSEEDAEREASAAFGLYEEEDSGV